MVDRRSLRARAPVFAALGDETRLGLIARLAGGPARSIGQLTEGSNLTRQAISKHLRVLESAGLVRSTRRGRESRFRLETRSLDDARRFLEQVAAEWDQALARLKAFVEEE